MTYIYYNEFTINKLNNLSRNDIIISFISAFFSIAPSIIFLNLIQTVNVNSVAPIIKPMGILITALFGIFLFNEKMSQMQIIGGIIILIGTSIFLL